MYKNSSYKFANTLYENEIEIYFKLLGHLGKYVSENMKIMWCLQVLLSGKNKKKIKRGLIRLLKNYF